MMVEEVSMKWMDKLSATEMEEGVSMKWIAGESAKTNGYATEI